MSKKRPHPTEPQFIGIAKKVMEDETILPVTIHIKDAWILVSGIQLATRHPGLHGPTRRWLIDIGEQFQAAIIALHPEAEDLLEMGWDQTKDR